jgi:hypothetical protein
MKPCRNRAQYFQPDPYRHSRQQKSGHRETRIEVRLRKRPLQVHGYVPGTCLAIEACHVGNDSVASIRGKSGILIGRVEGICGP